MTTPSSSDCSPCGSPARSGAALALPRRVVLRAGARWAGAALLGPAVASGSSLLVTPAAQAQGQARGDGPGIEVQTLNLRREDGNVLLDFDLRVQLPPAVEDALSRGVPLYFQAMVALFRPRWYWRDARVARVERQWRLSYQPLTGTYRVTLGAISQNHARLTDALATVSRLGRWQVADAAQAEAGERHYAEFSWRLDTTQLPRPMQFGLGAGTEWSLGVERTLRLEA